MPEEKNFETENDLLSNQSKRRKKVSKIVTRELMSPKTVDSGCQADPYEDQQIPTILIAEAPEKETQRTIDVDPNSSIMSPKDTMLIIHSKQFETRKSSLEHKEKVSHYNFKKPYHEKKKLLGQPRNNYVAPSEETGTMELNTRRIAMVNSGRHINQDLTESPKSPLQVSSHMKQYINDTQLK